jgi:Excreted virulence factor EspC, type VII ESX diderm
MNDRIQISPEVMRAVADQHDEVADKIAEARLAGAEIHAAVSSYGPIMHRVKAAVADLLSQRDAALLEHDATHRRAADVLRREATNFTSADELNSERLRF